MKKLRLFYFVLPFSILFTAVCASFFTSREDSPIADEAGPLTSDEPAKISTVILSFELVGEDIELCDRLTINRSGQYQLQTCQQAIITGTLRTADLDSLRAWYDNLAAFTLTTEQNIGRSDNLSATLRLAGRGPILPNALQQETIFEWAKGLSLRLRSQAVADAPAASATNTGAESLCPKVSPPRLVLRATHTSATITLFDPAAATRCDITLTPPPAGPIKAAAGQLYYPVLDYEAQAITIWQIIGSDQAQPLPFTTTPLTNTALFDFSLSVDGTRVAWGRTQTNLNLNPPRSYSNLWSAQIAQANRRILLNQVEHIGPGLVAPIRFSLDQQSLYYAWQPHGLDDQTSRESGPYHSLYRITPAEIAPRLIYTCPIAYNPNCIGDVSFSGSTFVYVESGQVNLLGIEGNPLGSISPSGEVIDWIRFSPAGKLAIISHAPEETYLSLINPPYVGEPETIVVEGGIDIFWGWLDERRLIYGVTDGVDGVRIKIVTRLGQTNELALTDLASNDVLAILR